MTRHWLIASIGLLSIGAAACGGYDEKNAAYDSNNAAAYDEQGNAAYGEGGNTAYDSSDANAGYTPAPDANAATDNAAGEIPPADTTTNNY